MAISRAENAYPNDLFDIVNKPLVRPWNSDATSTHINILAFTMTLLSFPLSRIPTTLLFGLLFAPASPATPLLGVNCAA
jgi:hypothetical protein